MRTRGILKLCLALGLSVVAASPAFALRVGFDGDATGEDIHVPAGEVLHEDIEAVWGNVRIDGTVDGDIKVVWSRLQITGRVDGDIETVGGDLILSGVVDGDIETAMTRVVLEDGAIIEGRLSNVMGSLERQGLVQVRGGRHTVRSPAVDVAFPWFSFNLGTLFMGVILLVLAVGLFPGRVETMAAYLAEEPGRWVAAPFVGIAALVGLICVFFFLTVTVIGLVLVPFLFLAFWLAGWFGLAAFYLLIGRRVLAGVREEGARGLLGPVLLGYLIFKVPSLIPCIGVVFCLLGLLLGFFGAGLAIMSAFGQRGGWAAIQARRAERRATVGTPPPPPSVEAGEEEEEEVDAEEPAEDDAEDEK